LVYWLDLVVGCGADNATDWIVCHF